MNRCIPCESTAIGETLWIKLLSISLGIRQKKTLDIFHSIKYHQKNYQSILKCYSTISDWQIRGAGSSPASLMGVSPWVKAVPPSWWVPLTPLNKKTQVL